MSKSKSSLSLRDLNFAKTRYSILQAFLKIVKVKEYENITIDEICNTAEISRGTFFNYFPSKEHIYTYYGWCFCAEMFVEIGRAHV